LAKVSILVQKLKNRDNSEQTDDVTEIKTFYKYSKPSTPKEPSFESFGLTESALLKFKKILYYSDFFGRKDFNFGFGHQVSILPTFYVQFYERRSQKTLHYLFALLGSACVKDAHKHVGSKIFIDQGCEVTNCYATSNNSLLCELLCY